jgi:hypothetical protein
VVSTDSIHGKNLRIEVERKIIAKRLGRLTGASIFAESQKLGLENSWHESGVLGCVASIMPSTTANCSGSGAIQRWPAILGIPTPPALFPTFNL